MKQPCVYILASKRRGALYVGVTSDLQRRMFEHRQHLIPGFTSKYNVEHLVWYRAGDDMAEALEVEKRSRIAHGNGRLT